MAEVTVKKTCCQFCSNLCGVLVTVEDGRVKGVAGDPQNPLSRGFVCERARLVPQWLYHPGQLMYPLKRAGRRGEGKWERITWDQAFGEIGQKLLQLKDEHGAQTLGFFEGTYRGNDYWPRGRFASLFGNPHNIFAPGIICGINDMAINMAVMGDVTTYAIEMSNSRCVVYWGSDPSESNMRGWAGLLKKKKRGDVKVIVVDPRQTKTAEMADVWQGFDREQLRQWFAQANLVNVLLDCTGENCCAKSANQCAFQRPLRPATRIDQATGNALPR